VHFEHQLDPGGLLHWQGRRLVATEHPADIYADLSVSGGDIGSVTHQTAGNDILISQRE
jgi:hypothetical protein